MPAPTDTMQFHFQSMTEMIEVRAKETPDKEVVSVPDKQFKFTSYTYREINDGANQLARYYSEQEGLDVRQKDDVETRLNTTILAPSAIDYAIHELAFAKLGHTLLFCSVNNSVAAIAHLLKATTALYMIVHPNYLSRAEEAIEQITQEGGKPPRIVPQAQRQVWRSNAPVEPFPRALTPKQEGPLPVFIVHSSGSTGFPKPIVLSHKASAFNVAGTGFGLEAMTTLPLFHNHGHACFYRAIHSGKKLSLFPTEIPLTTNNIIAAIENARGVQGFYVVPYVLKLLAESVAGIELLKGFELVTYGGAACPDELGDRLVKENGVKLVEHYGLTEVGQLGTSFRDFETDQDWNYIRFSGPHVKSGVADYLKFIPQSGGGSFEVVVTDGWKGKVRSNTDDGSYATSDLLVPHPSTPGAYKFVGRLDDTLVMVSGEKTNPVPIELTLKGGSPYIAEAIVFGAGKSHIGALILPTELGADLNHKELYAKISPVIDNANAAAPTHSQLVPEMLIFVPAGTVIPRADKASIIRPKVYKMFEDLIEEKYEKYERGEAALPGEEINRVKLTGEELARYVSGLIREVSGSDQPLQPEEDLFDYGLNSLQAARIRTTLQRELELNGTILPGNVVFENPSVKLLSSYLEAVATGKSNALRENLDADQMKAMQTLVEKYSQFAEVPSSSKTPPEKLTVVLTGATGSLGAHLLDQLLNLGSVAIVICLVRAASDKEALQRVDESLNQRRLTGLSGRSGAKVEAYPADLSLPDFGLRSEVLDDIQARVTTVIANAWSVNFTLNVESFEKGNIRAAYNLLNLAITSKCGRPADFFFSSSVSAVAAHAGPTNEEVVSVNPADAQGMGYARSKWVTENLVAIAASTRKIRAETFRIGQMVGDTVHGVWNETEAIPLQIKSAQSVGAMPDLSESLSWLPVDLAAKSMVEIVNGDQRRPLWHVLNGSKQTTWPTVHKALRAAGIDFKVLSQQDWMRELRNSSSDLQANPTYKLVDFFGAKYDTHVVTKRAGYSIEETSRASPTIASKPYVDEAVVGKFIQAWKTTGFLL